MEQADIGGEELDLHAQDILGKREVVYSKRYSIPRVSEGAE